MSKGRKSPQKKERKRPSPCACVRAGMPADLAELVEVTARVLWKFTEGREDWDEWVDVRNALAAATQHVTEPTIRQSSLNAIADFDQRRPPQPHH